MKNQTLLLLLVLLFQTNLFSQSCLPEGITFNSQTEIDSFQINYPNCTEIEGNVDIFGDNLHNLYGLDILTSIAGYLWINNCDSLVNLMGLHNLITIGGGLHLAGINGIEYLTGLEKLGTINGMFEIVFLDSIINLSGLDSLSYVGGDVHIHSNPLLSNLSGIENLSSTGGGITIYTNNNLFSLSGLQNLTSIGGHISIYGNSTLENLNGINNIQASSIESINISENENLSECDVQSICDYLATPTGSINIENNSTGCNSVGEVEAACAIISIEEFSSDELFDIVPNPANTWVTLLYSLPSSCSTAEISIKDISGKLIVRIPIEDNHGQKTIDISNLEKGVYLYTLKTNRLSKSGKLIIQ